MITSQNRSNIMEQNKWESALDMQKKTYVKYKSLNLVHPETSSVRVALEFRCMAFAFVGD